MYTTARDEYINPHIHYVCICMYTYICNMYVCTYIYIYIYSGRQILYSLNICVHILNSIVLCIQQRSTMYVYSIYIVYIYIYIICVLCMYIVYVYNSEAGAMGLGAAEALPESLIPFLLFCFYFLFFISFLFSYFFVRFLFFAICLGAAETTWRGCDIL